MDKIDPVKVTDIIMATNEKVGNEIQQRLDLGGFIAALGWLVEFGDLKPETCETWLASEPIQKMLATGEIRMKGDKGIGGLSSIPSFANAIKELCRAIAKTGKDEFLVLDTTISFFSKVGRMGQPFHWRTWFVGPNGMKSVILKKDENPFSTLFYLICQVSDKKKAKELLNQMLVGKSEPEPEASNKGKVIKFPSGKKKNSR